VAAGLLGKALNTAWELLERQRPDQDRAKPVTRRQGVGCSSGAVLVAVEEVPVTWLMGQEVNNGQGLLEEQNVSLWKTISEKHRIKNLSSQRWILTADK
jgi:hypothetical protein